MFRGIRAALTSLEAFYNVPLGFNLQLVPQRAYCSAPTVHPISAQGSVPEGAPQGRPNMLAQAKRNECIPHISVG